MHPHQLDFLATRSLLTPVGGVLLLAGALLAVSLSFEASESLAQRSTAREKQAQLSARAAELRGAKGPQARAAAKAGGRGAAQDEAETRRITEAQTVIRALAAPWSELFNALEAAQDETVALLTIVPERVSGRLAFTGEAKSYEALTAYLARLDESGGLTQAQLLAHEIKGGERNVVFSATASFRK